jgi:hypothetical protein
VKKNIFLLMLATFIFFWAVGTTSYAQEKTEKSQVKTEKKVVDQKMEKRAPAKTDLKNEDAKAINKVNLSTKDKENLKHHKKLEKMSKEKMKGNKEADSKQKEKSK